MLGGALVENILCLLAYNEEYAGIVRNSIPLNLYGGPYRIIAGRCYDFLDHYHKAPGDHIADLLEDKLTDETQAGLYEPIVRGIRSSAGGAQNVPYVIDSIRRFVQRQSLRTITVELTKCLQQDTEQSIDRAQELINSARTQQLSVFDPGTRLSDRKALGFLNFTNESFPTGIKELDQRGLGPNRKELHLLIANIKTGKSWWLTHLAKMAVTHRLRVVHITLEMSEERVAQRYFQALYGVAKRRDNKTTAIKFKDEAGRIAEFGEVAIHPKVFLTDPDAYEQLEKIQNRWGPRHLRNVFVKQFPTGKLTVSEMIAYLDSLEATQRFVPDLLIIDYPDLMKVDTDNARWSLDAIYKDIRGVAVERNIAVSIVTQSNRLGAMKRQVETTNVSEAYSKNAHADVVCTLSATAAEKRLGLARLSVAAARNDADAFTLVLSQHYKTGLFGFDSHLMTSGYEQLVEEGDENGRGGEGVPAGTGD